MLLSKQQAAPSKTAPPCMPATMSYHHSSLRSPLAASLNSHHNLHSINSSWLLTRIPPRALSMTRPHKGRAVRTRAVSSSTHHCCNSSLQSRQACPRQHL